MAILKFKTKKDALKYARFLKRNAKKEGIRIRVVIRKKSYGYVVIPFLKKR